MSERSRNMSMDSNLSSAEDVSKPINNEGALSYSDDFVGHDDYSNEEHEMGVSGRDDEDAESMPDLSTDSNDSFLESLIDQATPEFTFVDALSRVSVLSLLAYTHKNLVSFIHVTFEGIKDPGRRISLKLYDLYDEDNEIVDADTWDIVVQPGSTIKMKYREPDDQISGSTNKKNTHQATDLKELVDFDVPQKRRLGKHNKSIYRRKLKEKAARAAKVARAKEEAALSHSNIVESGRRMRGRTFFRDRTKRKRPQPAPKATQPPAIHFKTAVTNVISLPTPLSAET